MKTDFTLYVNKLKELATNLKGIEHNDADRTKHFAVICTAAFVNQLGQVNIDEVLDGVRSLMVSPCLIADLPGIGVQDENGANKKNNYAGAFLILVKSSDTKLTGQLPDLSKCQHWAEKSLGWFDEKYKRAEEEGTAEDEWNINWSEVDIQPIVKLKDNWVGVRVNLPFKHENEVPYEYDESAFVNPL